MKTLEVKQISKTYGTGDNSVKALKNVSFEVEKGEFTAIIGESGSGKSTLLNIVGDLDKPTSGTVLINGKNIHGMKEKEQTVFRRRNIGFIFLLIISLVSIINIVNSIIIGVAVRTRQYGIMRAIGTESSQITGIIRSEALTYSITGCLSGLTAGLISSRWLYGYVITSHFPYSKWHFPVLQISAIILVTFLATLPGIIIPSKKFFRSSITDTINSL